MHNCLIEFDSYKLNYYNKLLRKSHSLAYRFAFYKLNPIVTPAGTFILFGIIKIYLHPHVFANSLRFKT